LKGRGFSRAARLKEGNRASAREANVGTAALGCPRAKPGKARVERTLLSAAFDFAFDLAFDFYF